jgi:hypothetical protein
VKIEGAVRGGWIFIPETWPHPIVRQPANCASLRKQSFHGRRTDQEWSKNLGPIPKPASEGPWIHFFRDNNRAAGHKSQSVKTAAGERVLLLTAHDGTIRSNHKLASFVAILPRAAGQTDVISHGLALPMDKCGAVIYRTEHIYGCRFVRNHESVAILQDQVGECRDARS